MNTQPHTTLASLDSRAREIFRTLVETYLETGAPVGSRTLSKGGVNLSPASIRNTLADLAAMGLLDSPHTSAGRIPTHTGLRLFVDGMMQVGELSAEDRARIERDLGQDRHSLSDALKAATGMLSGFAGGAGIVTTPKREAGVQHIDFVPLGEGKMLIVLVFDDGGVENRLTQLPAGFTPMTLDSAARFLNTRLRGKTFSEARKALAQELEVARRELDDVAATLVEGGMAAWVGSKGAEPALIVRGRANLLEDTGSAEDLERVRQLFDDLEDKKNLIQILDTASEAEGVRIFIGAESQVHSLSSSAVIAAPYHDTSRKVVGAIGVIGPARLNYARVIPMVDFTARLISQWMQTPNPSHE